MGASAAPAARCASLWIQGLGYGASGLGFMIQDVGLTVSGIGPGLRVWDLDQEFRIWSFRFLI